MSLSSLTLCGVVGLCASIVLCQSGDRVDALEKRVAQLELAQSVNGMNAASTDGVFEHLKVRHLSIVDQAGNERIWLRTYPHDEPTIALLDPQGVRRLEQSLDTDGGPRTVLSDADQKVRVRLESPTNGAAGLGIWGKGPLNETSHVGLWIWENQTIAFGGGLRSADAGTFHIQTDPTGATTLTLRGPAGDKTFQAPEP